MHPCSVCNRRTTNALDDDDDDDDDDIARALVVCRMWDTLHTTFDRSGETLCTVGGGRCGRRVAWQRSVGGTTVTTDAATSSAKT